MKDKPDAQQADKGVWGRGRRGSTGLVGLYAASGPRLAAHWPVARQRWNEGLDDGDVLWAGTCKQRWLASGPSTVVHTHGTTRLPLWPALCPPTRAPPAVPPFVRSEPRKQDVRTHTRSHSACKPANAMIMHPNPLQVLCTHSSRSQSPDPHDH